MDAEVRQHVVIRLTLLYGTLFLASGIVLLAATLFLVFRTPILVTFDPAPLPPAPPRPVLSGFDFPQIFREGHGAISPTWATVRAAAVQSALVLVAMAALSAALGWFVAGRVLERLEAAFEAQRRFIANASHELRTPLAMMRTSLDMAVAKPGRPPEVDVLGGKLREGLDAADRLLEGLLLLARTQSVERVETSDVSVADLVDAALRSRAADVEDKQLSVERYVQPVVYRGNGTLLASLVDNLVDNAIRHNEPGGWLRVALTAPRDDRDRIRFVVENGGPVLAQSSVDLLGQPFQRLGRPRTSQPGTGLGVSIAAAVAAVHHGRLLLRAREEGGLRVEAEL